MKSNIIAYCALNSKTGSVTTLATFDFNANLNLFTPMEQSGAAYESSTETEIEIFSTPTTILAVLHYSGAQNDLPDGGAMTICEFAKTESQLVLVRKFVMPETERIASNIHHDTLTNHLRWVTAPTGEDGYEMAIRSFDIAAFTTDPTPGAGYTVYTHNTLDRYGTYALGAYDATTLFIHNQQNGNLVFVEHIDTLAERYMYILPLTPRVIYKVDAEGNIYTDKGIMRLIDGSIHLVAPDVHSDNTSGYTSMYLGAKQHQRSFYYRGVNTNVG